MSQRPAITIHSPLRLSTSFAFPLQSERARREVLIGAALLLVPVVGWLLNMGHRIEMVHRMQHGLPAWPAWGQWGRLLKHGIITWLGMVYYFTPAGLLALGAWRWDLPWLLAPSALLFFVATVAIPGYMSHYCVRFDPSEIYNPLKAFSRVIQGGAAYWKAWGIALSALALSFLGLLALGVGFLVTSVWFWQVAGFSFASVFSQRHGLGDQALRAPA